MQFALPRKYRRNFVCRVFSVFCDAGVAHFFDFFLPSATPLCTYVNTQKKGHVIGFKIH